MRSSPSASVAGRFPEFFQMTRYPRVRPENAQAQSDNKAENLSQTVRPPARAGQPGIHAETGEEKPRDSRGNRYAERGKQLQERAQLLPLETPVPAPVPFRHRFSIRPPPEKIFPPP